MKPLGISLLVLALGIIGVVVLRSGRDGAQPVPRGTEFVETAGERFEFSALSPIFRFSAELPKKDWQVRFVPEIEAIDVGGKIFIRHFRAADFLTLSTVTIHSREATTVHGHAAVRYEIEKKPGVPDFPHQLAWRNQRHRVLDIRFAPTGTTEFYVFAYDPELDESVFNDFIESLQFHNDRESFVVPLSRARERVTKKPFGLYVEPGNSPVTPEKFSGYHSGVDFETFANEEGADVAVRAICGGPLLNVTTVQGYGGVAVEECILGSDALTVVYGHIRSGGVAVRPDQYLAPGQAFAVLGRAHSAETDGERKHLHLGIRKGASADLRGYVQTQAELGQWIDVMKLLE